MKIDQFLKQHKIRDNILEKIQSYKYLGINFNCHLNWSHNVKKRNVCGWKAYYDLENKYGKIELWDWFKKISLSTP
jgi:hypothetical protein